MTGTNRRAVLDRFEGEVAVLLIEEHGEVVDEVHVETVDLPEGGRHQDAIFALLEEEGDNLRLQYLPEVTEEREEMAQDRFDQMSNRLGDEDAE